MTDFKKPISFRPTSEDAEVLELIAEKNPVLKSSTVDLIRIALQDYMFNHGPESKRSKSARLDRHEALLLLICEKLGIDTTVLK